MRLLGAVLAGGRSSRFGSDKALALLGGRPLLDHAADLLRPHVAEVVVAGRGAIPDRPAPDLGPLGGLTGALHHAAAHGFDAVLTTACDAPLIPTDAFPPLVAAAPAYLAELPVAGCWPVALLPALEAFVIGEDRSMRGWARAVGADRVVLGRPIPNINTAADLAEFTPLPAREGPGGGSGKRSGGCTAGGAG